MSILASGCGYTWGIEHMPLISGPGPHSRWMHVVGGPDVYDVDVHFPRVTPATTATDGLPLVIVLHGYGGTGPELERRTGFSRIADSAGFVVAYPNAQKNTQGQRSWIGSDAPSPDDVMLLALIDSIAGRVPVDRHRVYLAGFSNGGMMTYRTAMALSHTFAAIGVVAGSLTNRGSSARARAESTSDMPIPLVAVHGMRDGNVPFDSPGPAGDLRGAPVSVRTWAERNRCAPRPAIDTLLNGLAVRATYTGCAANATTVLYATTQGVHGWPTASTREAPLSTSDILWRFFSEYRANDSLVAPNRAR